MSKSFVSFVKGVGAGAVIGMALYASGCTLMNNNKRLKKKVCHATHTISDVLDGISGMLR